jgi:hypothetical protein
VLDIGGQQMKRVAYFFAAFAVLLLTAVIVVPLVVDVDQYRPLVEETVNEQISGRVSIGKLSLSLWGRLKIEVDGLTLKDPRGRKQILVVEDAHLDVPFLPIIQGNPQAELILEEPRLAVVRDAQGSIDLLQALAPKKTVTQKPRSASAKSQGAAGETAATLKNPTSSSAKRPMKKGTTGSPAQAPASEPKSIEVPELLAKAEIDIELLNAAVDFTDEGSGAHNELTDINFLMRDVRLGHPVEARLWAEIDSKMGDSLLVEGPLSLKVVAEVPQLIDPEDQEASEKPIQMKVDLDLDEMQIESPGQFTKSDDDSLGWVAELTLSDQQLTVKSSTFRFSDLRLEVSGSIPVSSPEGMRLSIRSNPVNLAKMRSLSPAIPDDLSGTLKLSTKVEGSSVRGLRLDLESQGTEVSVKGRAQWAPTIDFNLDVRSPGLDLSPWMSTDGKETPQAGEAQAKGAQAESSGSSPKTATAAEPGARPQKGADQPNAGAGTNANAGATANAGTNANPSTSVDPLASIRSNPALRRASGRLSVKVGRLSAGDFTAKDFDLLFTMGNLAGNLQRLSMKTFKGLVEANARLNLRPEKPPYQFSARLKNIDLKTAVSMGAESFKNTAYGRLDLQMKGNGQSIDPEEAKKNLNSSGKLEIKNARFVSIDVNRMITVAANGAMNRAAKKVPQLKGKKLKGLPKAETRYEWIRSDFTIKNGVFKAPNFATKVQKRKGVDLKGYTEVGLVDDHLTAKWKLIDTYDLTQATKLTAKLGAQTVPLIVERGKKLIVPVKVGCKLADPCVSYGDTTKYFAKLATKNLTDAGKREASQRVNKATKKNRKKLEKKAKKALKGFFR